MNKQIRNETESYYLKYLSEKYCSFQDKTMPVKGNVTKPFDKKENCYNGIYKELKPTNNK